MIKIDNQATKKIHKFWNHALFHPTDAVEDSWGRRILDRMSADGAIKTIRIYSMFEDIVYVGENGELCYDFRTSDLRIDYLLEKNFDILLAYACVPDCIASSKAVKTCVSKSKTRYKGKMWNSYPPKDASVWEEICFEYTKHLVERYGESTVASWHCHCFNEPDLCEFFLHDVPRDNFKLRCDEYCKMYDAFVRGVRRASKGIRIGGPALAQELNFLDAFLNHVRENNVEINYVALHNYGTGYTHLNNGTRPIAVENQLENYDSYMDVIRRNGFDGIEIVLDEWGASAHGFFNVEECPVFIFREHEVYSSYFAKLVYKLIEAQYNISKMMICLSGQHEMVTDFSGFRNFFTLNFITKPIYNAHLMTSKMGDNLLDVKCENENVFVVPTKDDWGKYGVLLTYCSKYFKDDLPEINEQIVFAEDISDKTVTLYCIDQNNTNPYRMWERLGKPEIEGDVLTSLRKEGKLVPKGLSQKLLIKRKTQPFATQFSRLRQNKRKKPQNEAKKSMTKRGSEKSSFSRAIQFRGELV